MGLMKNTILLIGSGRLAKHLRHWQSLQINQTTHLLAWDRHQDPQLLRTYIQKCSHVWLAISDSAIVPFFEKHLLGFECKVVHFSGALHDDRLISAHPMMSFPDRLFDESVYNKIYFALSGCDRLQDALPDFYNHTFKVNAENKALYHAICVVAGNFPQLLWSESLHQIKNLNIPEEALINYIRQITLNFVLDQNKAITGPLVRKDITTIEKNKKALSHTKLIHIYEAFEKVFHDS